MMQNGYSVRDGCPFTSSIIKPILENKLVCRHEACEVGSCLNVVAALRLATPGCDSPHMKGPLT